MQMERDKNGGESGEGEEESGEYNENFVDDVDVVDVTDVVIVEVFWYRIVVDFLFILTLLRAIHRTHKYNWSLDIRCTGHKLKNKNLTWT